MLEGCIICASGPVLGIKLELSACVEGDVDETKGAMRILLLMMLQTIATTQAKTIKVKLLREI